VRQRTTTPTGRRMGLCLFVVLAGGGLLVAACTPPEDPDDGAAAADWNVSEEFESQAGDDLGDADGLMVAVDPACAEIGDGFTVTVAGLDLDADHVVAVEPEPSATSAFEPEVTAPSDGEGELQVTASLSEEADLQPGDYEVAVYTAAAGEADEWLHAADLEIAETCEV